MCDDWFEKDLEDFSLDVKKIKKKINKPRTNSWNRTKTVQSKQRDDEGASNSVVPAQFQEDFGGNYNKPGKSTSKPEPVKKSSIPWKKNPKLFFQAIPFQMLKTISEHEPLEIYLDLSKQFYEFFETLTAELNTPDRVLQTLIEILAKLCRLPLHETRKYILAQSWLKVEYWNYLLNYVQRLSQHETIFSAKKVMSESNLNDLMSNILSYCKFFIWNMHYGHDFVKFLGNLFDNYIAGSEANRLTKIGMELEQMIVKANENVEQKFYNEIYPTLDELKAGANSRMNLKPNVVRGRYPNVRHYIEIHLALLKEDFIAPLRDGITAFMAANEGGGKRIPNIRVYEDVKFNIVHKTRIQRYENILVELNLSRNKLKARALINSKKFMFGSLLCFTSNRNLDDLILGVVTNRDNEVLTDGMIQIDILKMYNVTGDILSQKFIMLESEIYFEPYHQVYNVLKNLDYGNFPLQKYIIDCETEPEMPDYVPDKGNVYYTYNKYLFNVKDFAVWPSPIELQLDHSQFTAFQGALTRKFCTIQGPPGTGKTYIGLQIIAALLENTQLQILIICLTNHALDQFLAGILTFTDQIVRMGSMSKNPLLDRFNLKKLNEDNFEMIDKRIRTSYYTTKKEYTDSVAEFEVLQTELGKSDTTPERKQKLIEEILVVQERMRSVAKRLDDVKQITDYNLVRNKRVIGMTTTYAARCRSLLKMLRAPIVLIEETGEVLESHVIATLTEDTQHLIMIGDHQQLRPATSVYQLALEYKMDISLFERMINNGINCLRLTTQHRQRPEFANLIRPSIYHELYDHESVRQHPNVKGVAKNLFFINHSNLESKSDDETTVKNPFEAHYLIYLCNYLILQGYQPNEITILTLYNGQMLQLLNERKKFQNLANVRISVVDNFQGEENKIILLSLVRSNTDGTIGYLAMKNRVCVALSRARDGFYIIGNMKLLRSASTIWKKVEHELLKQNAIADWLPLQCQTHGNITNVAQPHEFSQFTYGGCLDVCGARINNDDDDDGGGQTCDSVCHTNLYKHYAMGRGQEKRF